VLAGLLVDVGDDDEECREELALELDDGDAEPDETRSRTEADDLGLAGDDLFFVLRISGARKISFTDFAGLILNSPSCVALRLKGIREFSGFTESSTNSPSLSTLRGLSFKRSKPSSVSNRSSGSKLASRRKRSPVQRAAFSSRMVAEESSKSSENQARKAGRGGVETMRHRILNTVERKQAQF
jgi:hypothetical protein